MTNDHVIEYIIEVRISFIVSAPSTIHDFKLLVLQHVFHFLLGFIVLFLVPHAEEAHFSDAKPPLGVFWQL